MSKFNYESINIVGANNGFIIQVGCKTLVFKNSEIDEAMKDLGELITGGNQAEELLRKKYCPEDQRTETGQCYPDEVRPVGVGYPNLGGLRR